MLFAITISHYSISLFFIVTFVVVVVVVVVVFVVVVVVVVIIIVFFCVCWQPLKALVTNMQEFTPTGRITNNSMMLNVDDVKNHIESHNEWRTSAKAQGVRSHSANSSRVGSNNNSNSNSNSTSVNQSSLMTLSSNVGKLSVQDSSFSLYPASNTNALVTSSSLDGRLLANDTGVRPTTGSNHMMSYDALQKPGTAPAGLNRGDSRAHNQQQQQQQMYVHASLIPHNLPAGSPVHAIQRKSKLSYRDVISGDWSNL